ncbi:hypothetical protein B0H10DRAFT_2164422 [Mycena sp. CBHHK59/15]|nr:hypothetical protein B0H10DRAFT_2164422 [Mycena sp. CBHHK59/15]
MQPGWPAWQQQQGTPRMLGPAQFMVPPPADPSFYAAHQQAMLIAKQAYQMAVAQQAMAVAGEEWERGSTSAGWVGAGACTPGPPWGRRRHRLAWHGHAGRRVVARGGMFPPAPRSMYGGGGARSDSSRSVYGEAFGPSTERYAPRSGSNGNLAAQAKFGGRESGYFPPVPAVPQGQGRRLGPGNPRSRTASQPASPSRGSPVSGAGNRRPPPPPSSWKASP